MKVSAFDDPHLAACAAAAFIADRARIAMRAEGVFTLALSGGRSPQEMFDALAASDMPWTAVHLFQVDERLAVPGSKARNFSAIRERLLEAIEMPKTRIHPMPVDSVDPRAAAGEYARTLRTVLGPDGSLDLVHLGLGADGHTASLLPGDPAAAETAAEVVVSRQYQGYRRLSLSMGVLSAARQRVWLVTGSDKREALAALVNGDLDAPAGRVERRNSFVYADRAALENCA